MTNIIILNLKEDEKTIKELKTTIIDIIDSMTTKLNSFILPNDVIRKMKDKLRETEKIGIEHGFNLCRRPGSNILIDRTHCVGNECIIRLKKVCGTGETLVGDYHTHPVYGADPSFQDMITQYETGLGCIGSVEDNEIKCFVRKDKTPDPTVVPSIREVIETYEKPLEKMTFEAVLAGKGEPLKEKLTKAAYYYRDRHFNQIKVE